MLQEVYKLLKTPILVLFILSYNLISFLSVMNVRITKEANAYQNANVAAESVITLYTNGPAIESASLCMGASCP